MTDDARPMLTEEERARIHAARSRGGLCALCGRSLVPEEPVWLEKIDVGPLYGGKAVSWRAPVGRECASPEALEETAGEAPEPCVGCGRGVLGRATSTRRQAVVCSTRCRNRGGTQRGEKRRS